MTKHCPKCGHPVDTQENFDCSKCGEQFWQSKEKFASRTTRESDDVSLQKPDTKLEINFWLRLIVSPRFSEYFLKGFFSGIIFIVVGGIFADIVQNDKTSSEFWRYLFVVLMDYWAFITVGYIYGYLKYRTVLKEQKIVKKQKKNSRTFCPKCGKKVDNDSVYCIFCGSKINIGHTHHSTNQ